MNEQNSISPAQNKHRWIRGVVLALVYGGLLAGGHWGSEWLIGIVGVDISPDTASHARHVVMVAVVFYTALMAMPFVPGIEISLALFAAFGPDVAVVLYVATVVALIISYLIGRLLPARLIAMLFGTLGLRRAEELMLHLAPLNRQQRLEALITQAPKRIVPTLLRHRYIAVIVILNTPGNAIIGGGGGIAMLAGLSGLFTFPRYLAIIVLAVMPVPLAVMFMGS